MAFTSSPRLNCARTALLTAVVTTILLHARCWVLFDLAAPSLRRRAAAGSLLALLTAPQGAVAALRPAAKLEERRMQPDTIAADLRIPNLPAEDTLRRQTSPSETLKGEKWYVQGKRTFLSSCAGCHQQNRDLGGNFAGPFLTKENLVKLKDGSIDESSMQYTIRYGKGRMPGSAIDCEDMNDAIELCRVQIPLPEEKLRDLQDFVMNRILVDDWKGEITYKK